MRRQRIALASGLALAGGYLVSDSFWPLLVWCAVWGIAFALISVGGVAIMLDLSRDDNRGRTVGIDQ